MSLFMQKEWGNQTLIPSIFLLDVFLVSVVTDGFLYGAVALVLFTPVGIAFGLVTLPWQYYLLGLGLILAPLLVMEIAKLCGLIRHHGRK